MVMFYSYVRNYGDLYTRFGKIQNYDQDLKMVMFYSYVKLPEGNNPRSGYLVGGWDLPLWKMMEWKSVGVMTFPTEWKVIKFMFQTTNQWLLTIINHY